MVLPMLPREQIEPVYRLLLDVTCSNLNDTESSNFRTLKSYIKKEWITRNNLSIYNSMQIYK